jgi:hypothetical protein
MADTELSPFKPMADGVLASYLAKDGASYFLARKLCQTVRYTIETLVLIGNWGGGNI